VPDAPPGIAVDNLRGCILELWLDIYDIIGDCHCRRYESAMKINVAQQLREPVGSARQYAIDETGEDGFLIQGDLQLLRTNRSILVRGRIETSAREICSRCLNEFEHVLALDIEEEYFMTRDAASGLPFTPPTELGTFAVDENNLLDLGEAVRQYTLLARPMKPVCREDCAGLCPQCGRNRNYETCDCMPVRPDSAWAPLQELLSGKRQGGDRERG
jgi:uncharacterized protein